MRFDNFLKTYLTEAINRGDVAEGIFAAAIATLIANGEVNASDLNKIRQQVDPKSKNVEIIIDSDISDNPNIINMLGQVPDPQDKITVILKLFLKPASVKGVYGPDMKRTRADKLIQTIINKAKNVKLLDRVKSFVKEVLTNNKPDDVVFYVTADGAGNTDKAGVIKSDVNIVIEAKTNTPVPDEIKEPIRFSLKVGEVGEETTVLNSGLFQGLLTLGKMFNLPIVQGMDQVTLSSNKKINAGNWMDSFDPLTYQEVGQLAQQDGHFFNHMSKFMSMSQTPGKEEETKQGQIDMYKATVKEIMSQLEEQDDTKQFQNTAKKFLESTIFGEDLPDVISISDDDIREINKADFDRVINDVDLDFTVGDGGAMIFRDKNSNRVVFRIKPTLRDEGRRPTVFLSVRVSDLIFK